MPDETFSFNQVVGKRTPEAGFKPATAYSGGKVVQEYGGEFAKFLLLCIMQFYMLI